MKELSLNILDVSMNSVAAGADLIQILITEKTDGSMILEIVDNGCGMSAQTVANVTDPFYTTRTTRKVGLGVPLLKMTAEQTGGSFSITSVPEEIDHDGRGTHVTAVYDTNHIDFTPLGDMVSTMTTLIQGSPDIDFLFRHEMPGKTVELDTRQVRLILGGDIPLDSFEIIQWLREFLQEQYDQE